MSKGKFWIVAAVLAAFTAAVVWIGLSEAERPAWDVCYEMTDRNVEWSGAGYSGIYGR